eukprot:2419441-Pleurochrysis_carterae.AAC.8
MCLCAGTQCTVCPGYRRIAPATRLLPLAARPPARGSRRVPSSRATAAACTRGDGAVKLMEGFLQLLRGTKLFASLEVGCSLALNVAASRPQLQSPSATLGGTSHD